MDIGDGVNIGRLRDSRGPGNSEEQKGDPEASAPAQLEHYKNPRMQYVRRTVYTVSAARMP
jgi:hypothetical protein